MTREIDRREHDRLLTENQQLRDGLDIAQRMATEIAAREAKHSRAALFVWAVVGLAVLATSATMTIYVVRPDKDNTSLIAMVLGFLGPPAVAFVAAAVKEVYVAMNSRLSQLMVLQAKASYAEGERAERSYKQETPQ